MEQCYASVLGMKRWPKLCCIQMSSSIFSVMLKCQRSTLHQMHFLRSRYVLFTLPSSLSLPRWRGLIDLYSQELLTRHKMLCAEFLEANYDQVFTHYQQLLNSENYVTRRQSLKLLGELLLDRHNFTVRSQCTQYIQFSSTNPNVVSPTHTGDDKIHIESGEFKTYDEYVEREIP